MGKTKIDVTEHALNNARGVYDKGNRFEQSRSQSTSSQNNCYIAVTDRESQTVIHRPVTFEGGACMSLESNKTVARVAQTTIQEEFAAQRWTFRPVERQ
jgi:hypothetical protein